MTDSTIDVTGPFDRPQKLLKITDNGDGTYSVAASVVSAGPSVPFDTILITYTDSTKDVISKVEWKLAGSVVQTLTPTFASTTDTWVKT